MLYHFKTYIRYYIKLIILFAIIISSVTLFFTLIFSFKETLNKNKVKLNMDNYFKITSEMDINAMENKLNDLHIDYEITEQLYLSINPEFTIDNEKHVNTVQNINVVALKDFHIPNNILNFLDENLNNEIILNGHLPQRDNEITVPLSFINSVISNTETLSDVLGKSIVFENQINDFFDGKEFIICGITNNSNNYVNGLFKNIIIGIKSDSFMEISTTALHNYKFLFLSTFEDTSVISDYLIDAGNKFYGVSSLKQYSYENNVVDFSNYVFMSISFPLIVIFIFILIFANIKFFNRQKNLVALKMSFGATLKDIVSEYGICFLICCIFAIILSGFVSIIIFLCVKNIFRVYHIYITLNIKILEFIFLLSCIFTVLMFIAELIFYIIKIKRITAMRLLRSY